MKTYTNTKSCMKLNFHSSTPAYRQKYIHAHIHRPTLMMKASMTFCQIKLLTYMYSSLELTVR